MMRKSTYLVFALVSAAALAAVTPAQAAPGDMMVGKWLAMVDNLKSMGIRAMFSSDIKVVKSEAQAAGLAYKSQLEADHAAGRPPRSCPTKQTKLNSQAFMDHLNSYSPQQRQITSMKQAMSDMFAKYFPCPRPH